MESKLSLNKKPSSLCWVSYCLDLSKSVDNQLLAYNLSALAFEATQLWSRLYAFMYISLALALSPAFK